MWKILTIVLGLIIFAAALTFFKSQAQKTDILPSITKSATPSSTTQVPKFQIIAKNLEVPWALAFLPDKSILFTERSGRLRLIDKDGNLVSQPIATISDVKPIGEGGLLGIALHPDFVSNHFLYLYYTYSSNGSDTLNRVVRYKFEDNSLKEQTTIVDHIPGSSNHNGGRIKFGPDRYLYITTGDAENPSQAQDKNSLGGKILRVTDEGKAVPDNPYGNLVYSYGHRNPQGIAWDKDGRLWATEHGRSGALSGLDELNLIEKGKNYGWPTIQGDEKKDGMVTPIINSGPNVTWAPAGATYFNGSIFFGGLRGQTLYQAIITGSSVSLKEHFKGEFGRLRDVVLGPDNMLYTTTSNRDGRGKPSSDDDRIIQINPNQL